MQGIIVHMLTLELVRKLLKSLPISCRPNFSSPETLVKLNELMNVLRDNMAGYKWMTALPQLISRISHKNDTVVALLKVD